MSVTTRELPVELTQAENLPSLPTVAVDILRLTQNEDATLDDLAKAIGRDPALAAKMLKLANSAMFSTGASEITTLQRAVMQLGIKTVKLMSLSFSLVGSMPKAGNEEGFSITEYWHRSLVGAVASRELVRRLGSIETDEAFLCGLLAHIGKLVVSRCLPEQYDAIARGAGGWPTLEQEQISLGFHSADVSAALLQSWTLPARIVDPVAYLLRPEAMPSDLRAETRALVPTMHLAQLATEVECSRDRGRALAQFQEGVKERLGWDEAEVDRFFVEIEVGIQETARLLEISMEGRQSPAEILAEARNQMIQISLGTAADLSEANRRAQELESETKRLEKKATTDALTDLPNRAAIDDFLGKHLESRRSGRVPRALGVLLMDVDKFKVFNDTYGHEAGDEVLRMVGRVLARETRKVDKSARYGGEEFIVVCPQTNPFGLKALGERLRKAIEAEVVQYEGQELRVTASFGAACLTSVADPADGKKLVKLADHYLYKAKENGRNRCEVYPKMQLPGGAR